MLKNFRIKTHCRKSHAEPDVEQLFGFNYQRNMTSRLTRMEPSGSLRLGKYSRSITGVIQNRRYGRNQGNAPNYSSIQCIIDIAVKSF